MNNEVHKKKGIDQQQSVDSIKPGFVMPDDWHGQRGDTRHGTTTIRKN